MWRGRGRERSAIVLSSILEGGINKQITIERQLSGHPNRGVYPEYASKSRRWLRAYIQIKELTLSIHLNQGVDTGIHPNQRVPRAYIQIKELILGIHPNQIIGPGQTSKSKIWHQAYIQIKELVSSIHPNQGIGFGLHPNHRVDHGHTSKSRN